MNLDDLELELRRLPGVVATAFDQHDAALFVQLHVDDADGPALAPGEAARVAARHTDRPIEIEIVRSSRPAAPNGARTRGAGPERRVVDDTIDIGGTHALVRFEHDELTVDLAAVEAATRAPEPSAAEGTRGSRPRLLAVLSFPDSDELEVHVVHDGRRTIGRSRASRGLEGAVEATIDAVQQLGAATVAQTRWARTVEHDGTSVLVAVALDGVVADAGTHYGLAAGSSPIEAAARSTLDAVNRRLTRLL